MKWGNKEAGNHQLISTIPTIYNLIIGMGIEEAPTSHIQPFDKAATQIYNRKIHCLCSNQSGGERAF